MSLKDAFLGSVCIAILVLCAYTPAISGQFIWDDDDLVSENLNLRSLEGLKNIWSDPNTSVQYYPLTFSVFWVEHQLWGLNPAGFHLVNILIHIFNAILVWFLLRQLSVPGSFLAAIIFAVHPVHVESVAWISELKNVLSGLFYLLAVLAYLKFNPLNSNKTASNAQWFYRLSVFFFICALLSKTVTATLPVLIVLLIWWKKNKMELAQDVLPLVPFVCLGIAAGLFTAWIEKYHGNALGAEWSLSAMDRILIAGRAFWFYVSKIIWPQNLSFFYPRWQINSNELFGYLFPFTALGIMVVLLMGRKKWGRGVCFASLFFVITLFPALGFFDIETMKYSFVADHYQYLASLGIIALIPGCVDGIFRKFKLENKKLKYIFWGTILSILVFISFQQGQIYRNKIVLFSDVISKNPLSWAAYNYRGFAYLENGQYELAYHDFETTLKIKNDFGPAYTNRGIANMHLGKNKSALDDFQKAISINSEDDTAYYYVGSLHSNQGEYEAAIKNYTQGLEINSMIVNPHNTLLLYIARAKVYAKIKRFDLAVDDFNKAIQTNPYDAQGFLGRGYVYQKTGNYEAALKDMLKAQSLGAQVDSGLIKDMKDEIQGSN